jgi:hypothetical protein
MTDNPVYANLLISTNLLYNPITMIANTAVNNGWTDLTTFIGDPDCDATQTFGKGNVRRVVLIWAGEGTFSRIREIEWTNAENDVFTQEGGSREYMEWVAEDLLGPDAEEVK